MRKINLELPKYRLELHAKLIKRREPLVVEPIVPTPKIMRKKYRSGTFVGKVARYVSEHKATKKLFAFNLSAVVIAGTIIPSTPTTIQAANTNYQSNGAIIQTQNTLDTIKSIQFPLTNIKVNQGYGIFHPGVDLGGEIGDPITAIKAGRVVEASYATDGYGNTVLIDHGKGLVSRYAHLNKIEVTVEQEVTTKTEIGKVGVTGHSTGPHLHLEIRQNGIPLNPLTVLSR
jgi:murein DD-endopeptidase MepM/ murein hydrolase activator NlpD